MYKKHILNKLIDNCQNIENIKESIRILITLVDFDESTNDKILTDIEDELVKGFEWNDSDRPTFI